MYFLVFMSRHTYIAFEWLDGSGKDTQKDHAIQYIQKKNKYAFIRQIREPSVYTDAGKKIKGILSNHTTETVTPLELLKLFVEDRVELSPLIKEILNHSHVISSRCFLSSYAYQQTQWIEFDTIDNLHSKATIRYPDHIIYFDLSVEEAERRIINRLRKTWWKRELFETKEFQQCNRKIYTETIDRLKTKHTIHIIDGSDSIEEVFLKTERIIDEIMNRDEV